MCWFSIQSFVFLCLSHGGGIPGMVGLAWRYICVLGGILEKARRGWASVVHTSWGVYSCGVKE